MGGGVLLAVPPLLALIDFAPSDSPIKGGGGGSGGGDGVQGNVTYPLTNASTSYSPPPFSPPLFSPPLSAPPSVLYASALASLAGFLSSLAGPNLRAVLLNSNPTGRRGLPLALQGVTDDLGKALGPALVARFIKRMGRKAAFNLAVSGWIPCGILLLAVGFFLERDEQRATELAERLREERRILATFRLPDGCLAD